MKTVITSLLITSATITVVAQDKDHTNYYKNPDVVETDMYTFEATNAVSRYEFCKFGYKLENTSNDYLVYKFKEPTIKIGEKDFHEKDKDYLIKPSGSKRGTINADGDESFNFHHNTFQYILDGVYRLPIEGEVQKGEDFILPASQNDMEVGEFEVELKKVKQETKVTKAQFIITYKGDNYGLVDPSKIAVSVPKVGDKVFANGDRSDLEVLQKGEDTKINVEVEIPAKYADMQFAELHVLWKDALRVSKLEKLEAKTITFEVDEAVTKEKN